MNCENNNNNSEENNEQKILLECILNNIKLLHKPKEIKLQDTIVTFYDN